MAFKIGDSVIMTADSKKGDVFEGYEEREYRGNIFLIDRVPRLIVQIEDEKCTHYFNTDGSNDDYPGMSIRLAEDKVAPPPPVEEKNPPSCLRCNQAAHDIDEYPCTSSQWIEGQIPLPAQGGYCVHGGDFKIVEPFWKTSGTVATCRQYTHYMSIDLPPPPPAKEVEAYGYLEYIARLTPPDRHIKETLERYAEQVIRGETFYSQPATAESLEKYLDIKGREKQPWRYNREESLDQFISQLKSEQPETKLIFKAAALDELGVK